MSKPDSWNRPTRRALLRASLSVAALAASPVAAQATPAGFERWRTGFRQHALSKGITEGTWERCMGHVEPDMSVFKEIGNQPEFNEEVWQYINRRVSDWRIITGKARAQEYAPLLTHIESSYGVDLSLIHI